MGNNIDYNSLIKGISDLNFTSESIPCKLLVTGDTAFPVLVTPTKQVLIAASKYGKGRLVVMSHESYLNEPQFMDFLKNAISWLKPSPEAVVGVVESLGPLAETLSTFGHNIQMTTGLRKDLGVFCMTGYDGTQVSEITSFLREGGGLLIGAQAWDWSQYQPELNVFYDFPGNKITSIAGIYFTNKKGDNGNFSVNEKLPFPVVDDVDFSVDLKQLLKGVSTLDITGGDTASELLLHGPLTFPIGMTDKHQCYFAAAYYGRGRILVGTHEAFLLKQELKSFILNSIKWLDAGRNGRIGVYNGLRRLPPILQGEGISCAISDVSSEFSVYCCNSYNDAQAEKIQQFVAEGGGLLIGGHAWYWAYSNPNVLTQYPGNKILNKFGISILSTTIKNGNYNVPDPESLTNTYHFLRAVCQLLCDLKNDKEPRSSLTPWLSKLSQDALNFLKLPASPLTVSLWEEISCLILKCNLPEVSVKHPVSTYSKEAFILCIAQEVQCLYESDQKDIGTLEQEEATATIEIDGTNPGGDAWRSTGLYLPPNTKATLVFPASVVGKGLQVQVGCHSDNLSKKEKLSRAPVVVYKKDVNDETVVISNVWGGLLYVIVKEKSQLGNIPVTVYGAEPAPTFIKGQTSLSSWLETIRSLRAPWAELITENIILTVPSDAIRSLENPDEAASLWEEIMWAIADLASIPKKFPRPERIVADVQISVGSMHSGYPIMCHLEAAPILVIPERMRKNMWGPIHELGHNQQRGVWEFPPHTGETTCNLWSVYVHETVLGIPSDKAHSDLLQYKRENRTKQYLKNGANLKEWNVWTALETYLQLKEGFGWDPYKQVFLEYQSLTGVSNDKKVKMNLWAEKFSKAVNKNLAPFFKAWGWPIDDETSKKLSILPPWEEDPMKKYVEL